MKVLKHKLSNGIVLLGERNPDLESMAFTILIPGGAATDPLGKRGMAGLVVGYLFKGAGGLSAKELANKMDELGVWHGHGAAREFVTFSATVLPKNLPEALKIFRIILTKPEFPKDSLKELQALALQRLKSLEDNPQEKLFYELGQRFFPPPLSNPPWGVAEDIASISYREVISYWENHYIPEGTIIAVAGNFDWEKLLVCVEDEFSELKLLKIKREKRTQETQGTQEHIPKETEQVQIGIAYKNVPYPHPDYFKAGVGVMALSGGMSSRLFREVREKRGLAYTVFALHVTTKEHGGIFCYVGTTPKKAQKTLEVTLKELSRLKEGITQGEFEKAKINFKSGFIVQGESSQARSSVLAQDQFYADKVRSVDEMIACVEGLRLEEINEHLLNYAPRGFTILTVGRDF
jgi:predicted Zn-dependent peptidase